MLAFALILAAATPNAPSPDLGAARSAIAKSDESPPAPLLDAAIFAWTTAHDRGEVTRSRVAVIDFSKPSREKRLWVLDLAEGKVLFHELVAHGKGSGDARSTVFSDVAASNTSSLGAFRTKETYEGKHGYSLKLDGLEKGVNGNALERDIVIHGAWYVSDDFVKEHGRTGRSWGCPAVREAISKDVIDSLKDGALVFAWYPDASWTKSSRYVKSAELRQKP